MKGTKEVQSIIISQSPLSRSLDKLYDLGIQLQDCISALAPRRVYQTKRSHPVQGWAPPRRSWASKLPL